MVKNKYKFLDAAGLNFKYLYFIELSLQAARQSPQSVQEKDGFLFLMSCGLRASYLQKLEHFMQRLQLLSIYILKGLTYLNIFTIVPMGQYIIQWIILPFLCEIKINYHNSSNSKSHSQEGCPKYRHIEPA